MNSVVTVVYILITSRLHLSFGEAVDLLDIIDLSQFGARLFGNPDSKVGEKVDSWNLNQQTGNPEELGSYLEGDILFPKSLARNGLIAETSRWPDGVIPFEIVGDYGLKNANEMDILEKAINAYHDNTCIKFVPKKSSDESYITIQSSGSGCWSSVGRVGGRQLVNLQANGCLAKVGTVIHEFMHVCGFTHEQNREERDDYVQINKENIIPGYENNFAKAKPGTTTGFGRNYDFKSVMHYSAKAFSVNKEPTIVAKKHIEGELGQRDGFSKDDIEKLRKMYKCSTTTSSSGYKPSVSITPGDISNLLLNLIVPFYDKDQRSVARKKSI